MRTLWARSWRPLAERWWQRAPTLWVLQVGLALLACRGALRGAEGWWPTAVQSVGLVAQMALLFAVALSAALALARAVDRRWAGFLLPWALCTALQILLFSSTSHYLVYGYHLDGRAWTMLTLPGSGDMLDMGAGTRMRAVREVGTLIVLSTAIHCLPGPVGRRPTADRRPAMQPPGQAVRIRLALALALGGGVIAPLLASKQPWWDAWLGGLLASALVILVIWSVDRRWAWAASPVALAWALAALAGGAGPVSDLGDLDTIGSYALVVEWCVRNPVAGLARSWWWLLPLTAGACWAAWRLATAPAEDASSQRPAEPDRLPPGGARDPGRVILAGAVGLVAVVVLDLVLGLVGAISGERVILESHRRLGTWHLEPTPLAEGAPLFPAAPDQWPARSGPELGALGRRLDILVVAIESARFDMLDPEVMPELCAFAEGAWVLDDHRSTGIESRYGVFGLLTGRLPTWWDAARDSDYRPAWFAALDAAGYRRSVFSCTTLANPELREAVFADLPSSAIRDRWPEVASEERHQRDVVMTDAVLADLAEADGRPSFRYLFYDASHFPYAFPEHGAEPALPVEAIDVPGLVDADPATLEGLRARYRNALRHVDRQLGRLFAGLRASGRLAETAVIVVGDHGEEFGELGSWGGHVIHNGAFDRYQVSTIGVVRLPGAEPRVISAPTSHLDLVPTLLRALGCEPVGYPGLALQDELPGDRITPVVGYDEIALVGPDWRVLRLGRPPGDQWWWAVHDARYRRETMVDAIPEAFRAELERVRGWARWPSTRDEP